MITGKKVSISGITLLLLVAGLFLSDYIEKKSYKSKHGRFFQNFSVESCGKVIISKKDTTAILALSDSGWTWAAAENGPTFPADSVKVISMIDKIELIKKDQLSSKGGDHTSFGVTEDEGIVVQVFNKSNKDLGSFIIGKKTKNWRDSYLRKVGEESVYTVGGTIRYAFKVQPSDWRDKAIFNFSAGAVAKVAYKGEKGERELIKTSEQWLLLTKNRKIVEDSTTTADSTTPKKVEVVTDTTVCNPVQALNYLEDIAKLKTADWQDEALTDMELGFITPYYTLTVTLDDGSKRVLLVGNKQGERPRRYVKSNMSAQTYILFQSPIDFMIPEPQALKMQKTEAPQ